DAMRTAVELSALFPRDTRPRFLLILASGLKGQTAVARQLLGEARLPDDDQRNAQLAIDLLDVASEVLKGRSMAIAGQIQGITRPASAGDMMARARLFGGLPDLVSLDQRALHLRLAPCVRAMAAPILDKGLGPLLELLGDDKGFAKLFQAIAQRLPDPLFVVMSIAFGDPGRPETAVSRVVEEQLAQALAGAGPFLAWPP